MGNLQSVVNCFFNILSISFTYGSFTFSLLDVFYAGLILSVIGLFVGKIILFLSNAR